MRKLIVIVLVAFFVSVAWLSISGRQLGAISKEEAIARIKAYVIEKDKIPEENVLINEIELRQPTEIERSFFRSHGIEPPELVWVASVTRLTLLPGTGPPPPLGENLKEPRITKGWSTYVWLDAYTGNVL